jgi:hypothetical protein
MPALLAAAANGAIGANGNSRSKDDATSQADFATLK